MIVGFITVQLRIPMARSLKDRRNVLRSLTDKINNKFNVAVAEVNSSDQWKNTSLAVVTVGGEKKQVEQCLNNVLKFIDEFPGVFAVQTQIEYY